MNCDTKIKAPTKIRKIPTACFALGETIRMLFMSYALIWRLARMTMIAPVAESAIPEYV